MEPKQTAEFDDIYWLMHSKLEYLNPEDEKKQSSDSSMAEEQSLSSSSVEPSPQKPRRINKEQRDKILRLFKGQEGEMSNKMISKLLNINIRKVQILKKQFTATGNIQSTEKNRHSQAFKKRKQLQDRIMKQSVQHDKFASLKTVQANLKDKGFSMCVTNVCARLNQMGYFCNFPPKPEKLKFDLGKADQKKHYAEWLMNKYDEELYYSGSIEINLLNEISVGWHRKQAVSQIKQQISENNLTFIINFTFGYNGVVGWSVKCKDKAQPASFSNHVKENFNEIMNETDCLLLQSPKTKERYNEIRELTKQPGLKDRVMVIPGNCTLLDPIQIIWNSIKGRIVSYMSKRPLRGWTRDPLRELSKIEELAEGLLIEQAEDPEAIKTLYHEARSYCKNYLERT